jgi:uncharacterized membrane protein YccC
MSKIAKSLEQAVAEAAALPQADQEQIGQQLLSHIERLRELRREIDKGLRSLDAGEGRELDLEKFIAEQNARHRS